MIIKKFLAPTLSQAFTKAKRELGENAVILKTRFTGRVTCASMMQSSVELTAAIDYDVQCQNPLIASFDEESPSSDWIPFELSPAILRDPPARPDSIELASPLSSFKSECDSSNNQAAYILEVVGW